MKKIRNNHGLTLVELLCCVAILTIFTAAIALGMRFSNAVFFSTTQNSEARTLISEINASVSDEFRYASGVQNKDKSGSIIVSYTSAVYGSNAELKLDNAGHLCVETTDATGETTSYDLLPSKAYTKGTRIANLNVKKVNQDKGDISGRACITVSVTYDICTADGETLFSEKLDVLPLRQS